MDALQALLLPALGITRVVQHGSGWGQMGLQCLVLLMTALAAAASLIHLHSFLTTAFIWDAAPCAPCRVPQEPASDAEQK